MTSDVLLRLQGVVKQFGTFTALHGVDLDINEGEFFTIVGPSGSGKSTIIRLLVGMDEVSDGTIWLRGNRIDKTPANERPTCMVFQSLALFPHMSVGQNIEFPLKLRKVVPDKRKVRALELLDLLRLPRDHYDKRISQCSGGEQQRVALARALAFDPEILFFDEPLSACNYSGTPASVNPYRALQPDIIVGYLTISICCMIYIECRPRNGRLAVPWTNSLGVCCWHAP